MGEIKREPELPEEEGLRQEAETELAFFARVLQDVETDDLVDLNRFSEVVRIMPESEHGETTNEINKSKLEPVSNREALETILKALKKYFEYLPQETQNEAQKLIIRAEIYIANDKFEQKQKTGENSKLKRL